MNTRCIWVFIGASLVAQIHLSNGQVQSTLAELPLDKLLNVRQSINNDIERLLSKHILDSDDGSIVDIEVDDETLEPGTMPLKGDWYQQNYRPRKTSRHPEKRGDWESEKHGKGKDVSKIFQTSVTILAFLAFGGYLLCMIIMAIRNNQGLFQTTATPTTATGGRKKREDSNYEDPPLTDTLVDSLHRLAEGYAKFHFSK